MRTTELYTTGNVAEQLDIERWRLAYLIEAGRLPPPAHVVPGRRLFTSGDIERMAEIFKSHPELRGDSQANRCDEAKLPKEG